MPLDPRSIIVGWVVHVALYNTYTPLTLSLSLSTCASPLVLCLLFAKKPHRKPSSSHHERVIKICCIHFTPGDNVHLLARIEKYCIKTCLYSGTRRLFVWCRHLLHLASVVDSLLVMTVLCVRSNRSWAIDQGSARGCLTEKMCIFVSCAS